MLGTLRILEIGFLMFYCQAETVHCSFLPPLTDTGETQTVLNVTGYFNYPTGVQVAVVMENVTWYTAVRGCKDLCYDKLDSASKHHMRTSITAALLKETQRYGNISLWAGLFKPNVSVNEWISVNDSLSCSSVTFPDFDDVNAEHQCAVNVYDVIGSVPMLRTRNCSSLSEFQCVKWQSDLSNYTPYDGYAVQEDPPRTATHIHSFNFTMCLDYCDSRGFCIGFTYNIMNNECSSYHYNDFGDAFVNYSLTYVGVNVSHYTKKGMAGILEENVDSTLLRANASFECPIVSTTTGLSSASPSSMPSSTTSSSNPSGSKSLPRSTICSPTFPITSLVSSLTPPFENLNGITSPELSSSSSENDIPISSTVFDTSSTSTWSDLFTSGISSMSKTSSEASFGPSSTVTSGIMSTLSSSPNPSVSLTYSDMSRSSTPSHESQSSSNSAGTISISQSFGTDATYTSRISVESTSPYTMSEATSGKTSTVSTPPSLFIPQETFSSSIISAIARSSPADTTSVSISPYTSYGSTVFETFASTSPTSIKSVTSIFTLSTTVSSETSTSRISTDLSSTVQETLGISSSSRTKTITTMFSLSTSSVSSSVLSNAKLRETSSISSLASSATSKESIPTSEALSPEAFTALPSLSPVSPRIPSTISSSETGSSTISGSNHVSTYPNGLSSLSSSDPTIPSTFTNVSNASTSTAPSSSSVSHDSSSSTWSKLLSAYSNTTSTSTSTPPDASSTPQSSIHSLTTKSLPSSSVKIPLESSNAPVSTDSSSTLTSSKFSTTSFVPSTGSESQITEISTELFTSTAQAVCGCKDYCPSHMTENDTELDKVVNVLVRNLTINPRETNKYKQSLVCLEDDRISSKAIAAISVSIVSILFGSIVISDLSLLVNLLKP